MRPDLVVGGLSSRRRFPEVGEALQSRNQADTTARPSQLHERLSTIIQIRLAVKAERTSSGNPWWSRNLLPVSFSE